MTFSLLSDEYKSRDVWGLIDSKAHLWKFFSKENTFIKTMMASRKMIQTEIWYLEDKWFLKGRGEGLR